MIGNPFAITLNPASSRTNHTGSWRTERPIYETRLPPCQQHCPALEQPREWLSSAEESDYRAAWDRIVAANPFPAVIGRVCYHPCETACNRGQLDEAVGINAVERFLGDEALRQGWALPEPAAPTGHRLLVVGAGPAGLSAAYQLRLRGHTVVVRDRADRAGGLLASGIPRFRLPSEVFQAELDRLRQLGLDLELGHEVSDLSSELVAGHFTGAVVAVGAQLHHRAYLPAGQGAQLLDALSVLADTNAGGRPKLGRRVAVYGGGNTALDAARTARRLGADEPLVIYRRDLAHMPADPVEISQAIAEGIRLRWLSTIRSVTDHDVEVEVMTLDSDGVPVGTGRHERLSADSVLLAIGEDVDHRLLDRFPQLDYRNGRLQVDRDQATGVAGVWAAGDVTTEGGSVTAAIGEGARAATAIAAWLAEQSTPRPEPLLAGFDRLHPWYFSDAPRTLQPELAAARRINGFDEVVGGLTTDTAQYEARRCLSCGSCFGCDNCYGVCPDNAVIKLSAPGEYRIDLDYCKGCGLCAAECPSGAITMYDEPI